MAGFSDTFETNILKLLLNATAIANIADNAAASPLTNVYVALHTADPGDGGNQSTNEANYTGYARLAIARTTGGWTISGTNPTQAIPAATTNFGACTAGSNTITHMSIGVASSGATAIIASGPVTPNVVVSAGITPQLTPATIFTLD
jgi:hypothetical protein